MPGQAPTDALQLGDAELASMVADLLGAPEVEIVSSVWKEVPYEIPAITTAGRYLVTGHADVGGEERPWSLFVKHVQEWSRSPHFSEVPEPYRERARQLVPWRTEGAVYRSDLGSRLPHGLAMPRAVGVRDLDESSYAVWMEVVPTAAVTWDRRRYRAAATLLGRFAGSARVRELTAVGGHDWDVSRYAEGRLAMQVVPALLREETWQHPLVREAFGPLRGRLVAAAQRLPEIVEELMGFPTLAGHGDGCPNNLLVRPGAAGFTVVDFGFFGALPLGFDLSQLLVGDVQIGRRSSADLRRRDADCVLAYQRGLLREGVDADVEDVRRAHALQLLLFTGLTTVPLELLAEEATRTLLAVARSRADIASFSLDLLDETA